MRKPDFARARSCIDVGLEALAMAQRSSDNGRPNPDRERQAADALRAAADAIRPLPVDQRHPVEVG